jgi:3-oxoacyl-[acyl-carrier protein] reductase
MPALENRIVLITGAGQGMGRAHALHMAGLGADIVVNDVDAQQAAQTADAVRRLGRRAHVAVADIADVAAVRRMVGEASASLGAIDILVNNAGFGQRIETSDVSQEDFDRMFAVHVRGAFFCTQAVVPAMKARRSGKILNISSIWGMTGAAVAPHYCAAKAALLGLTKAWAKEFAPWNIHVNAVAPGAVWSGAPTRTESRAQLQAKAEAIPLKRRCEPVEISHAVAFLCSPQADFVTGQVLSPNGGETIVGI